MLAQALAGVKREYRNRPGLLVDQSFADHRVVCVGNELLKVQGFAFESIVGFHRASLA